MHLRTKGFFSGMAVLAVAALLAAPAAFAFEVADTDGKRHRLADYKGKWVVVNFWATWCAPCIKEIPEIAEFREANAARAVVIGIALDVEGEAKTLEFAKKVGHAYPLVLGDDRTEKQFGKVKGLPTTLVFDPAGKRVYDRLGTVTRKSLEQVVDRQDTRRGAP
jgi:thiol-disulfide isomerase/thioredoxin